MFSTAKHFIIVGNNEFIIKKENDFSEEAVKFQSIVPNVPFYHHLYDQNRDFIAENSSRIKKIGMKNVTILLPDDTIDIEVDKRLLSEYFVQYRAKVSVDYQCFYLCSDCRKYISISKTSRIIVMQYIMDAKVVATKYYDKELKEVQRISQDIKELHMDCRNGDVPVFINNVGNDMEGYAAIGKLITKTDMLQYISGIKDALKMKSK